MRRSLFHPIAGGFVAGILVASVVPGVSLGVALAAALVAFSAVTWVVWSGPVAVSRELREYSLAMIVCVFALAFSLGMLRFVWFASWHGDENLASLGGSRVTLVGAVDAEPARKESSTQIRIMVDGIEGAEGTSSVRTTRALAIADPYVRVEYGDRVRVLGTLAVPESFATDGGRAFDYGAYLAKDRVFYLVRYAKLERLESGKGNMLVASALAVKRRFASNLDRAIPYPESRLAAGLVVAGKQALPKGVQEEFVTTGTSQVVVLSGYNVTLVASALASGLSLLLPRLASLGAATIGVWMFVLMAGGGASVVRAAIMASVAVLAKAVRRDYSIGRALALSALVMLVANPMLLVFDASFQLSFVATVGLVYFSPIAERFMTRVPEAFALREALAATAATQLFATPFILYLTGRVSLVALPANMLLFAAIPATMLVCFVAGAAGFVSFALSWPFAWLAFLLLRYELGVVHIFSIMPFASVSISSFPWWLCALCYIGFWYAYRRLRRTVKRDEKRPLVAAVSEGSITARP